MKVGIIGLGRMGEGMSRRMMKDGIEVWGYRRNYEKAQETYENGYVDGVTTDVQTLVQTGIASAPRTNPYSHATSAEYGWLHCGGPGAGHFVKMVHNGVEYGIMQAYAEGFNILKNADLGSNYIREGDAEVAPMSDPENYQYDIEVAEVAELWRRGSVVGSWLLDLTADVLRSDSELGKFDGGVSDSGEGRWTVNAAVDLGVPAPVISSALYERFNSRRLGDFANKILNGMRYMFGGHHVR
jgi:6-phosphogluconate dehydrogenase